LEAVVAGAEVPVEDGQIDGAAVGFEQRRLGVGGDAHLNVEAGPFEPLAERPSDGFLVIDDQDGFGHARLPGSSRVPTSESIAARRSQRQEFTTTLRSPAAGVESTETNSERCGIEHSKDIPYEGGYPKLADDLGNLRYDALAEFLELLAAKIDRDAGADAGRGRAQLAAELQAAAERIARAWRICKPFMP
jgi:hypothetical protein